jgi:hypothetical protein
VGSVCVFGVDVEFLHGVEMGPFAMVMSHLQNFVDGAEWVCLIEEVYETGG